jgi:hypothetical protein
MSGPPAVPVFDWSHGHTGKAEAPCRHCHEPTFLRDDDGNASHKVCAEAAVARRQARAAANYRKETLT